MLEFIISVIFIIAVGCGLHFAYELSHQNKFVALFAAVNESTWEHIKLALSGVLLWSFYDGVVYGTSSNYFIAKTTSTIILIILIPALFYGYRVFAKKSILPIDITIFCLSIIVSQYLFYVILSLAPISIILTIISFIVLLAVFIFYAIASYYPPKIWLFRDPITKKYGLEAFTSMLQHGKNHNSTHKYHQHKK